MDEVESIMTRKDKEKKIKSEVDKVYEDDNWVIIRPKSHGFLLLYSGYQMVYNKQEIKPILKSIITRVCYIM